jgi:porin
LDGQLSIRAGRVTVNSVSGEEFMASEYFKAMASVGFNLIPIGLFLSAPGAFGYRETTWGARVKLEPVPRFYVMVGAYNGDPMVKEGNQHGVDFSLRGPLFAIGEVGLRWSYGDGAAGLPRNIKAGVYFNGGPFEALNTSLSGQQIHTVHGLFGLYVLGDQAILRWGGSSQNRHLGVFGAFLMVPGQRLNSAPYFFDTGVVAYGPCHAGLEILRQWGLLTPRIPPFSHLRNERTPSGLSIEQRNFESTMELTYGCAIKAGLVLQPSLQYIIHPEGATAIPNGTAIGINLVINF